MTAATDRDPALSGLLAFWFDPATRRFWFDATAAFDRELERRFATLHLRAAAGELSRWNATARGALGLVLLLDQIPRNLFRETGRAFATDPQARRIAKAAIDRADDRTLSEPERLFLYMPLEHSEELADQARAVALISALTRDPTWAVYARAHHDVVARFGRFPHRNAVLGRETTPEERRFLETEGTGW